MLDINTLCVHESGNVNKYEGATTKNLASALGKLDEI